MVSPHGTRCPSFSHLTFCTLFIPDMAAFLTRLKILLYFVVVVVVFFLQVRTEEKRKGEKGRGEGIQQ